MPPRRTPTSKQNSGWEWNAAGAGVSGTQSTTARVGDYGAPDECVGGDLQPPYFPSDIAMLAPVPRIPSQRTEIIRMSSVREAEQYCFFVGTDHVGLVRARMLILDKSDVTGPAHKSKPIIREPARYREAPRARRPQS
jgi:hypothetical protein